MNNDKATPRLESKLEEKFTLLVRRDLHGRTMKMIPVEKGAPDRLVLLPGGRIELVELKTDTGVVSPKQKLWHERARMLGVEVAVVRGEAGLLEWVAAHKSTN